MNRLFGYAVEKTRVFFQRSEKLFQLRVFHIVPRSSVFAVPIRIEELELLFAFVFRRTAARVGQIDMYGIDVPIFFFDGFRR